MIANRLTFSLALLFHQQVFFTGACVRHYTIKSFMFFITRISSLFMFFCLVFMAVISAQAQSVNHTQALKLSEVNTNESVGHSIRYFLAQNQSKGIKEAMALPDELWQKSTKEVPSFSIVSGDLWLRLDLKNDTFQRTKKILHLDYALLDYVEVFYRYGKSLNYSDHYRTGSTYPFSTRALNDSAFAFPVHLGPGQSISIYFRLQNDGFIQAPITLWDETEFYNHRLIQQSTLLAFISILVALAIYNIFLFFSVNEKAYLLFSTLSLSTAILISISSGLSIQYLALDLTTWNEKWVTICVGLMTISGSLLPIAAINLKTISKTYYYTLIAQAYLGGWIIFSTFIMSHSIRIGIAMIIVLISVLIITVLSFYLWVKRIRGVRLFAISWSLFLFGGSLMILNRLSLIPRNDSTEYLLVYSALIGLFLLSFSLANRINLAKKDHEMAQATSFKLMEKFYKLFQHSLEGIFTITTKGELIEANPAFCRLFGYEDTNELRHALSKDTFFSKRELSSLLREVQTSGEVRGYELKGTRSDGSIFWASIYLRKDSFIDEGKEVIAGTLLDVTETKQSQMQLEYLAQHDPLTGLFNRRKFMDALQDAINSYQSQNLYSTIIYIDLDQFKVVNDTCGHTAGDKLLKELTTTMSDLIPLGSCLARLGGDEFAIVLSGYSQDSGYEFAENIRQTISDFRFVWDDHIFSLGASIGIVPLNDDCSSVEYVLSLADTACFAAKDQGRNSIHIYDHERGEAQALKSEMHRVSEINQALEHGHFVLYQQAIVSSEKASTHNFEPDQYYEILVRMTNVAGDIIPPGLFLPAAERYNLMPAIDCWVVNNFCKWLASHPQQLENLKRASINLSPATINDPLTLKYITECVRNNNIPSEKICFEITESSAITNMDKTLPLLRNLRDQGFNLALDDFGSGFASYGYLKNLPFNVLKIDGCFIKDLVNSEIDQTIVKSVNDVAKALGMATVAEFVENDAILEILNDIGVELSQGYGIAKPAPINDLIKDK